MFANRLYPFVLVAPLFLVTACGASQARTNSPEAAEPSATEPARDVAASADPTIQPSAGPSAPASGARGGSAPPATAGDKGQPVSDMEARIISGAALPPSANGGGAATTPKTTTKGKKPTKGRKKS